MIIASSASIVGVLSSQVEDLAHSQRWS